MTKADKAKDGSSLGNKRNLSQLSVSELEQAERRIIKYVQHGSFPEDTAKGKKGDLAQLIKPFKEDGLLRLGARLDRSSLNYDARHPYILPKNHPVSELIILHYHGLNGHVGSYHILAKTRERFWIINGVSYVKRVLKGCHDCRRENARLGEQIMAPLPSVRVSSDEIGTVRPFDAVGIDYFGPRYVKLGPKTRSKKNDTLGKRFGCIFTSLRYRAVHIEVADDLSTDSFINAVQFYASLVEEAHLASYTATTEQISKDLKLTYSRP